MMFRPMRPNPLMPTLIAMRCPPESTAIIANAAACRSREAHAILDCFRSVTRRARRPSQLGSMYVLYTVVSLVLFVVLPRRASSTRRCATGSTSAACASGSATCPVSFNLDGDESIWIHAVSVGEALTARPLAAELKAAVPALRLFLSTTTMTGQQVARREHRRGGRGLLLPVRPRRSSSSGTLRLVKPRLFIMMETEIWPNLLRECRRARREDGGGQRAHLDALVPALPARPASVHARVLADVDRFCMQSSESAAGSSTSAPTRPASRSPAT